MKKKIITLIGLVLCLSLVGCTNWNQSPIQTVQEEVSQEETAIQEIDDYLESQKEDQEEPEEVTEPDEIKESDEALPEEDTEISVPEIEPETFQVEIFSASMYASRSLNVRSGPSTEYEKLGSLSQNQEVQVTGKASTGWYQIQFGDSLAYVSDRYLVEAPMVVEQDPVEVVVENEAPVAVSASYSAEDAAAVVTLVNRDRAAYGLSELSTTVELTNAAMKRAEEAYSYFSHTRPDGTSCFTVFDEYGVVYQYAGENLAWGQRTAEEAEEDWMNSEGHRANILTAEFNHIGVACYIGPDGIKSWVQLFSD
jgi:uncharacterized protein YkwD